MIDLSSLLRPTITPTVCVGLLAALLAAGPAAAAGAAPDPSPVGGYRPDPYPAAAPARVVVTPRAPTVRRVVVAPAPVRTRPPAHAKPAARPKHAARHTQRPAAKRRAAPAVRIRDLVTPRFPALPTPSVETRREISIGVALALAGFVLLSGLFVTGAARVVR